MRLAKDRREGDGEKERERRRLAGGKTDGRTDGQLRRFHGEIETVTTNFRVAARACTYTPETSTDYADRVSVA